MTHRRKNMFDEWDEQLDAIAFIRGGIRFAIRAIAVAALMIILM